MKFLCLSLSTLFVVFLAGCSAGPKLSSVQSLVPDGGRVGLFSTGACPPKVYACEMRGADPGKFMRDRKLDLALSIGTEKESALGANILYNVAVVGTSLVIPGGQGAAQGFAIGAGGTPFQGQTNMFATVYRPDGSTEKYYCNGPADCNKELSRLTANAQSGVPGEQWAPDTLIKLRTAKKQATINYLTKEIDYHKMVLKGFADFKDLPPESAQMKQTSEKKLVELQRLLDKTQQESI
jgi:hypothetical protein